MSLGVVRHAKTAEREVDFDIRPEPMIGANAKSVELGEWRENGDGELQGLLFFSLFVLDLKLFGVQNHVRLGILNPDPQLIDLKKSNPVNKQTGPCIFNVQLYAHLIDTETRRMVDVTGCSAPSTS